MLVSTLVQLVMCLMTLLFLMKIFVSDFFGFFCCFFFLNRHFRHAPVTTGTTGPGPVVPGSGAGKLMSSINGTGTVGSV